MQLLFNLSYTLLSSIFSSLFGQITAPTWFLSLFSDFAIFFRLANYFVPVSDFGIVIAFVLSSHIIFMLISSFLQLF